MKQVLARLILLVTLIAAVTLWPSAQSTMISGGSSLPAKCIAGRGLYLKTGTSAGPYWCSATDTWTAVAGSGTVNLSAATVSTDETRGATSYGALATAGPSVTLTHTGTTAVIWIASTAYKAANINNLFVSVDVSGSNTIAANDTNGTVAYADTANTVRSLSRVLVLTGLTPGTTTFTLQYKAADTNNDSHFYNRSIAVYAP